MWPWCTDARPRGLGARCATKRSRPIVMPRAGSVPMSAHVVGDVDVDVRDEQVGELVPALLVDEAEVAGLGDADGLDDLEPAHRVDRPCVLLVCARTRNVNVEFAPRAPVQIVPLLAQGRSCHEDDKPVYAERMFPAPVDLGIAQADRAVCNVKFGTSSYLEGEGGAGTVVVRGRRRADARRPSPRSSSIRRPAGCRPRAIRSSR